jgi:3-deoxy-D-manno-octulosonic-acid transferase
VRILYTLALRLALPLIVLRLWWRGRREPGYRSAIGERFGRYAGKLGERRERVLWVHAVSVGEARAAAPLVRALQAAYPDHAVLMTCTTAAGRETIRQVYGETVLVTYLPYDFPAAVQRFLEHFRPRIGILMETEVWPNLLEACARYRVPVLLANARMSEKSARGYARLAGLTRPAFQALAVVCAQSEADAARLRALGAATVQVTGNLKFDVPPNVQQLLSGKAWRAQVGRPVVLLASTRDGEERLLLGAFPPGPELIVVVPRHPQRFDEVAAFAESRRTEKSLPEPKERVHLGDTMGEMAFYFAACDVTLIGGSFAPLGGQNLIEALAAGAPVVTGPSMFNFSEATRLAVEAGAAIQASDAASAVREVTGLLQSPEKRTAMAEAGKRLCEAHRGATQRHLAACKELLERERLRLRARAPG